MDKRVGDDPTFKAFQVKKPDKNDEHRDRGVYYGLCVSRL